MGMFLGHMDFEFVRLCWSMLLMLLLDVHGFLEWAYVNFKIVDVLFDSSL
jgi:hypothetical protein